MSYIFSNRKMFIRVKRGKVQIGGRIKDHTEIGKFRQKHNNEQEKNSWMQQDTPISLHIRNN